MSDFLAGVVAWSVDLRVSPVGVLAVWVGSALGAVVVDRRLWRRSGVSS